jgi:hypothetical protein
LIIRTRTELLKPHSKTFVFILSLLFTLHPSSLCVILHPCTKSFIFVLHPSSLHSHPCTRMILSSYKDDNHLRVHLVTQNTIPRDTSPDYHFSAPQTFPPSMGSSCDPTPDSKRSSIICAPMVLHSCKNLSNSDLGNL